MIVLLWYLFYYRIVGLLGGFDVVMRGVLCYLELVLDWVRVVLCWVGIY